MLAGGYGKSAAIVALLMACSTTTMAEVHEVNVVNFAFEPADITVAPGDTIRWTWGSGSHTVTSGTDCTSDGIWFDSPIAFSNQVFEFEVPGDFTGVIPYFCRPHCVSMTGTIVVESAGEVFEFTITLDGTQEVPPVDTPASGTGTATLDTGTNELSWNITFADLKGPETAAHFHGAAPRCENAGPQITLPLGDPKIGSQILTNQQVQDVLAQRWYVNIHTSEHPGGEIRGQVMHAAIDDPIPAPIPAGNVTVELRTIADGLTAPNWGTHRPGHPDRLVVVDQPGRVWDIDVRNGQKRVFLDASDRLVDLGVGGKGTFDERGLLGLAFHPDYAVNGKLYTYTSEPLSGPADFSTMPVGVDADHQAVILEWQVPNPGDPDSVVDPNSARELLRIDEPQFNHDGGAVVFGPDGHLYVSLGDGGARDDERVGHPCIGNGQDIETVLGTVLRIDPDGNNSANGQYGIPADNPFVNQPGIDEIFCYGLRNPFRFSFDALTGEMYIADVGQGDLEEVNLGVSGGNYGWVHKEGSFFFVPNGASRGYVHDIDPGVPPDLIDPVAEYDHDEGISIIGGFVYRGATLPDLVGRYVFGDWNQSFFGDNGRLFYLADQDEVVEFGLAGDGVFGRSLHGFGQDARGEVYALANLGGIPFGDEGVVLKLIPETTETLPIGFTVPFGQFLGGQVSDLFASDDSYVEVQQRPAVTPMLPLIRVDVDGMSSSGTASVVLATVEAAATSIPSRPPQRISFRNYDTGQFERIDERTATSGDSVVEITICHDAGRFIEVHSNAMKMRLEWFNPGNVFSPNWGVRIDQARWAVAP